MQSDVLYKKYAFMLYITLMNSLQEWQSEIMKREEFVCIDIDQ